MLNWKVRIGLGIIFMAGTIFLFIYGFYLKNNHESFNKILALGVLAAAAGLNQFQKAVKQLK